MSLSLARWVAALVACASLYAAAPAAAAPNPYTHLADTYLMYHAGRNCVVTIKRAFVGRRSWTEAWLWRRNYGNLAEDQGNLKYFAGPVKRWANDRCVAFGGYASAPDNDPRGSFATRFGWCD